MVYIHITPNVPILPMKAPTIAGPRNVLRPAPRLSTDIAAPLLFPANEGINADNGAYAAKQAPKQHAVMIVKK